MPMHLTSLVLRALWAIVIGVVVFLALRAPAHAELFGVTNLVTNDQGIHAAQIADASLKNAWGVSHSGASPFWVSDNGTGVVTLYNVNPTTDATTKVGLVITIPGTGTVTGQASSGIAGQFNGDAFLFVSEDGTISGWRGALGTTAEVLQSSDPNNVYKGTTLDQTGNSYLLSANFHTGAIDVLKGTAGAPDLGGKFTDPGLPSGYAPFNVQNLGGTIYVAYALQDAAGHDDVPGAGHGFVTAFDLQGNFLGRIASQGTLNSPWGLAIAPLSFGSFAGDLLVGNFGDGRINAYNLVSHTFAGQLNDLGGNPLTIDGLWALIPGNGGSAGSSSRIYFSAGPDDERNGLFGVISLASDATPTVPEPSSLVMALVGLGLLAGCKWRSRGANVLIRA